MSDTLILGIGNDILTDDGIGPKLVRRLEKSLSISGIEFKTAAIGGLEIMEMIGGYARVILIDAIRTKNGIPGSVYQMTPADFKETLHASSFHDVSFLTALEFGREMEAEIPDEIVIIAIEIVEDLTFSDDFSPAIADKYEGIYEEVLAAVKAIIVGL